MNTFWDICEYVYISDSSGELHTVSGRRFCRRSNHWLLFIKSTNCNNILLIITVLYIYMHLMAFSLSVFRSLFRLYERSFVYSFASLEFVMTLNLMIVYSLMWYYNTLCDERKQKTQKEKKWFVRTKLYHPALFTRTRPYERMKKAVNVVQMTER